LLSFLPFVGVVEISTSKKQKSYMLSMSFLTTILLKINGKQRKKTHTLSQNLLETIYMKYKRESNNTPSLRI